MLARLARISAKNQEEYQAKMLRLKEEGKAGAEAWAVAIATTAATGSILKGLIAGCRKSKEAFDRVDKS